MTNKVPEIIDISSWKQDMEHKKVADAGVKVAICRTTVNQVEADIAYAYHTQEFEKVGIDVPGYMFPQFQHDVVFQVKCYLAMWNEGLIPPIVDLERTNDCRYDVVARKTTAILKGIEAMSRRVPIVYTRAEWFNTVISPYVSWQGEYPLWVAHYTDEAEPDLPEGWDSYVLWQYSKRGRVPGIRSSVDFNRLGGTMDDLWKGTYLDGEPKKGCSPLHKKR